MLHRSLLQNIQFICKDNDVKVIEANVRASRSLPFVSKVFDVDFVELATRAMLGVPVRAARVDLSDRDYVAVKVPVFSYGRLLGADPVLRCEMGSTGEVACFATSAAAALLKGFQAADFHLPRPGSNILLAIG
jgi:carbamoylphosphate synthase large subunit